MFRARMIFVIACGLPAFALRADSPTDPTARYPLSPPLFSIDPISTEVLQGFVKPGDILTPLPGPPPTVVIPAALHALGPADVIDGLSLMEPAILPATKFALLFSMDRASQGAVGPDPSLVVAGFQFNALDQSLKNQAAGDIFMVTRLFNRAGPAAMRPGVALVLDNNTMVFNQGDAGGVDLKIDPPTESPTNPYDPNKEPSQVDEGMGTQESTALTGGTAGVPTPFYFSLTKTSPALNFLPHDPNEPCPTGADIYVDVNPGGTGGEFLYVSHRQLGLTCNDDIDGIIVFDQAGNPNFTPGSDQVLFTLARGSPSANSPADIYSSFGGGVFTLWATPVQLGLLHTDNVTLLDYVPTTDVDRAIKKWAIGFCRCVGDVDCDGDVDFGDLGMMLSIYGKCYPNPQYLERADYDSSSCIDLADLATLLANYGKICGGP